MKHMKRQSAPKSWPIKKKGTAYIVSPTFGGQNGVPLLVVLRDMLKVAKNRKEVKKSIHEKKILINGKLAIEERAGILLFDKITIIPTKKNYSLGLSDKGKFMINVIKENEAEKKVAKITNKTILKEKKVQLNLGDGRNFISDIKCNINDSVVVNFKDKKIEKCLPMKDGSRIIVFAGKHSGYTGKILKINQERKMASIDSDGKKINVLIKQILVVE